MSTQRQTSEEVIDLSIGHPGPELLPIQLLQQATQARLSQQDSSLLQYGLEQGDPQFRLSLAEFLSSGYGLPVNFEELFITCGASQALELICTVFAKRGEVIFVEEPSYFLALRIFADHGLKVVAIPVDEQGVRLEMFEDALKTNRPKFFYTIPTFQNPGGVTLEQERRKRLVELAQQHDFLIIADEVYHLLSYAALPPAPLAAYAASGRILSLGSFSKILAPGLRLGWVQASAKLLTPLAESGLLVSGGGLNPFTSALVDVIVSKGWQQKHLERLRQSYSERLQALVTALQADLPEAEFTAPTGGYFVWLELPHIDTLELLKRAEAALVHFQPGSKFSSQHGLKSFLRLSFAHYPPEQLREGVARLQQLSTFTAL